MKATRSRNNPWGEMNPEKAHSHRIDQKSQTQAAASIMSPSGFLDQLFGNGGMTNSEAPHPSHSAKESKSAVIHTETVLFQYTRSASKEFSGETEREMTQILEKLKEQVTVLEKSEKALTKDIAKIKVEQLPERSGIYYIRFFEWMITVVRQLRAKVEEGRTWLAAMTTKKKRMGYWKMYKKHGTTFGLSNERTVATQSG